MLKVEHLNKIYPNGTVALKDVSFEVKDGEFLAVIGLSGSGKSTLLRCINRLIDPTSGKITWDGVDITAAKGAELRKIRRQIGMVFQQFNLVKRSSVMTNVLSGRLGYVNPSQSLVNYFSPDDRKRALADLDQVGLADKAYVRADSLSGGQQQRVGIARALMQEPKVILADEPVASLDPVLSHSILKYLEQLNKDRKITVICSLHFLDLVHRYATSAIALKDGELVFEGLPKQIDDAQFKAIYGQDAERVSIYLSPLSFGLSFSGHTPMQHTTKASSNNPYIAAILSLIIPGAGQVYLRKFIRGVAILAVGLLLAYLIYWAEDNFRIGQIQIGNSIMSWLWVMLALYAIWNIIDAYRLARGQSGFSAIGYFIPTFVIYLLAWQVTDVNLDRLVTRFSDAQIVFRALLHPDLFERDTVSQIGRVVFWVPCSNPPQPLPPPGGFGVALDKSCGSIGDPITVRGENFTPGVVGNIYLVESAGGTNEIQVREGGHAIEVVAEPDGRLTQTFKVPTVVGEPRFVGSTGIDPNNPLEYGFEVRVKYEVGTPRPSENFGDIIVRIVDKPAPTWLVSLGIVSKETMIPTVVPGKMMETIALGLLATIFSTILAFPISFLAAHNVLARVPGGSIIYYGMRTFLNIVRAIDTLIWGLIVVVWIGLGPFAGVLALTIHSIAALGKLFSEEIEHIDTGPVEAVTATGANLLQTVRYAVVPQIIPSFIAFTLLRWDINMRSATIIGFVAGGGIGFLVLETIRKGAYEVYAASLYAVAIVIIAVDYISATLRERIMIGETKISLDPPKPFYKSPRTIFYIVVSALVFKYFWDVLGIDLRKMFEPAPTFVRLITDFVSIDTSAPVINAVVKQMLITIFQALIATTLGGLAAIPFSFLAARNLTGRSILSIWIYYATRFLFDILRSIEALLYVGIFVFWVGIGPFAGTLALAITTFALIGKLFSEAIENIDPGPLEAITATGATRLQAIVYGVIPQIVPPFVSYLIYQWDINVRISTIIGFAGGGGIGLLFQTYANQLQYHKAGTVVTMIVIIVAMMDFASAKIREKMV